MAGIVSTTPFLGKESAGQDFSLALPRYILKFSQIGGRIDIEAKAGPFHDRGCRTLLPVGHQTILPESEAEGVGIPDCHRICTASVPIRREGTAAVVCGRQQDLDIFHREMRQIGMDHEQGAVAQLCARALQLWIEAPTAVGQPMRRPFRHDRRRKTI